MSLNLSAPQPLAAAHLLGEFDCGEPALDDWLKRRSLNNQLSETSRTFVVVDDEQRVRGFYALAAGAVAHTIATNAVRCNMPDPVPVMVLGRLAVDRRAQGVQLGAAMLLDAVHRAITVSQNTGVRALLVHALHEQTNAFYEHYGFQASPLHSMTLMWRLNSSRV